MCLSKTPFIGQFSDQGRIGNRTASLDTHTHTMDESALFSTIFESLRKCIEIREKYTAIGLQRKQDNPRDYPDLSVAPISTQISALKVKIVKLFLI